MKLIPPAVLMNLLFILFSIFRISTAVPIAREDPFLTLPKRASLQQVLALLRELNTMMKDSQIQIAQARRSSLNFSAAFHHKELNISCH